jgi:ribosomal-protein-alanine N-acetyltransferase
MGATIATLEVRQSNLNAQRLYERFNFKAIGILKGYYKNNQEDAVLMHLTPLTADALTALLESSGKTSS